MQSAVTISDTSNPGEVRRLAAQLCTELRFDERRKGEVAIVMTELCRNTLLHGGGGEVVLIPWTVRSRTGLDVLALDKGPGFADVSRSMEDGRSSAGTTGTGMGAISRLADGLDIYTQNGKGGAVVWLRMAAEREVTPPEADTVGALCVPVRFETACGDAWACCMQRDRRVFMVADGLGHGPAAAEASSEAVALLKDNADKSPAELIPLAHQALQKTRGAAVAVAEINMASGVVRYCGVGNISSSIVAEGSARSMVSMNGIVGHQMERLQEFTYPFTTNSLLVMHSDGLSARWNLDSYAGLLVRQPALIAGVLYRDFRRERDDATVVVMRGQPATITGLRHA